MPREVSCKTAASFAAVAVLAVASTVTARPADERRLSRRAPRHRPVRFRLLLSNRCQSRLCRARKRAGTACRGQKALADLQAEGKIADVAGQAGLAYLPLREPAILGDVWGKIIQQ
jgi:hypothetical protein